MPANNVKQQKTWSRDKIIKAANAMLKARKTPTKFKHFQEISGINQSQLTKYFPGGWAEVQKAIGVEIRDVYTANEMIAHFHEVCKKHGRIVSWADLRQYGPPSAGKLRQAFRRKDLLEAAYGFWLKRNDPQSPFLNDESIRINMERFGDKGANYDSSRPRRTLPRWQTVRMRTKDLNCGPFMCTPQVEQDIAAMFGYMALGLGYRILNHRATFPDVILLEIATGRELRCEYELYGNQFFRHGHPSDKVDLIVCWEKRLNARDEHHLTKAGVKVIELIAEVNQCQSLEDFNSKGAVASARRR